MPEQNIEEQNAKNISSFLAEAQKEMDIVINMKETLLNHCYKELDKIIANANTIIKKGSSYGKYLDSILLKIPTQLYYLNEKRQTLEIQKRVIEEKAKFKENEIIPQEKGTIPVICAIAANKSYPYRLIVTAYQNALSTIQTKIDYALELLRSAKILENKCLKEIEVTRCLGNSFNNETI